MRLDHITPKKPGVVECQVTYLRLTKLNYLNFLSVRHAYGGLATELPGGHSEWEPPDPFPNSEVKLLSADDSVGVPMRK